MSVTIVPVGKDRSSPTSGFKFETVPSLLPDASEDVFTGDVWLEELHLVNTSSSSVTVTISDAQSPAMAVVPTVEMAGNSDHLREFSGRYCPNGLTWVASVADVVVGYVRVRK